jgi:hypothetical protein
VRAGDAQVVEEPLALGRVILPGDPLHAPARLTGLTAVKGDARVVLRDLLENPGLLVQAERPPVLQPRVEPAGREHQQRRPVAEQLVARG